ncbi:MAG: 2,4'-dihydroxyacetophenone dioxygenase family protein [Pseudomonadota bacterium]
MPFANVDTGLILDSDLPWTPFAPYREDVLVKLFKADPVRGETITLLKSPMGIELPKHHHSGTVIVYTVKGAWRYKEHDWVATPGSIVFETAATSHTAQTVEGYGDEVITLNITMGDLLYLDDNGAVVAIENWRTAVQRYLDYCSANGLEPRDVTSFAA